MTKLPEASDGCASHYRGSHSANWRGRDASSVPAALVQHCLGFGGLGRAARTDLECHICRFSPPLARLGSPEHVKHGMGVGRLRVALHAIDWSYIMRGDAAGCAFWAAATIKHGVGVCSHELERPAPDARNLRTIAKEGSSL